MATSTRLLAFALLVMLALKVVVAQNLRSGIYMILPMSYPPFPVGSRDQVNDSPVILGGNDNVWTITNTDDGTYVFMLKQSGNSLCVRSAGNRLFMSSEPLSPSAEWRVQNMNGDIYSIVAPGGMAWASVPVPVPGSPVTLEKFNPSNPNQLWRFIQRQE